MTTNLYSKCLLASTLFLLSAVHSRSFAQTPLKQEQGSLTTNNGPVYTPQVVTLYNGASAAVPTTTVTYTLSNQQFGPSRPVRELEGLPTHYGISFGGANNSSSNSTMGTMPRNAPMDDYANALSNMYTACASCTGGIDITNDYGVNMFTCTEALIESDGSSNGLGYNMVALNARVYYGDLTISFNRPVSNPILQLVGMGGDYSITIDNKDYIQGFSAEFDLVGTAYTLSKIDGNSALAVSSTQITNAASKFGYNSQGNQDNSRNDVLRTAASGSVKINGTNITSVTFRVYVKGDGGYEPQNGPLTPMWGDDESNQIGNGGVYGDAFIIATTLQAPVDVTVNVFNDPNGGNVNNSTGVTNVVPSGLYASLVDESGKVVQSQSVGTDGNYTFSAVWEGTYTAVISTTQGVQGALAPTSVLPSGWTHTGDYNGSPNTGNTNNTYGTSSTFTVAATAVDNINFGIERVPNSDNKIYTLPAQPIGGTSFPLSGGSNPPLMTGTDPDDGTYTGNTGTTRNPQGVKITSLPTSGELWYNGVRVTTADLNTTLFANPALFSVKLTGTGYTSTSFNYAYVDAAGAIDPTPATYTLNWTTPLPVKISSFDVFKNENTVSLAWTTASEQNNKGFQVEHSVEGGKWQTIGFVSSLSTDGNSIEKLDYHFVADYPVNGINHYRLKQIDFDGRFEYSAVRKVVFKKIQQIEIYPNPTIQNITIKGLSGGEIVTICDESGRKVNEVKNGSTLLSIDLSTLSNGIYYINVVSANGAIISEKIVKTK